MTAEDFELNEPINSDESNVHQPSEPSNEQKIEISDWVAEGMGLSDIQKKLTTILELL